MHKQNAEKSAQNQSSARQLNSAAPDTLPQQLPPIVQLQRIIGNRAVQRMPEVRQIESTIHHFKPQKSFLKTKPVTPEMQASNDARMALLDAIANLHIATQNAAIGRIQSRRNATAISLSNHYNNIISAADKIIAALQGIPDRSAKASHTAALEIKVQATNEKSFVLDKLSRPPQKADMGKNIASYIAEEGSSRLYMNEMDAVGTVGGAMNELTKYQNASGTEYFKPNTDSLDFYASGDKQEGKMSTELDRVASRLPDNEYMAISAGRFKDLKPDTWGAVNYGEFRSARGLIAAYKAHLSKGVNREFAGNAGIDLANLKSSQREVAMSRLDILLQGNLISNATLALSKVDGAPKLGSLAKEAPGQTVADLDSANNKTYQQDPVLQSRLSALYMIDFLAGQADRHQGNYMVQVANDGKVLGLTGIDNDMAFGTKDAKKVASEGARELPALGKFFDKEMASKIMKLDTKLLGAALSDLLGDKEIIALCDRLDVLKQHLQNATLLEPNQWQKMITTAPNDFVGKDYVFIVSGP